MNLVRGVMNAVRRAGCVKLANRQAGQPTSLPLIRAWRRSTGILLCEAAGYRRLKMGEDAMENDDLQHGQKRRQHLRVPVFPQEKAEIEANARQAGYSVARYLREVGCGYPIKSVMDYQYVRELVRVNGDLGRLGGLLKLWLTDDVRTARFSELTIMALLGRIEATQLEMSRLMKSVLQPRARP